MTSIAFDYNPAGFLGFAPSAVVSATAGGSGDNIQVSGAWFSALGNHNSSSAHGVSGTRSDGLAAVFGVQASLAASETLLLKGVQMQTAPADGSGDPDAGAIVALALPDTTVRTYSVAGVTKVDIAHASGVLGDITVATGAVTGGLFVVAFTVPVVGGLEFVRARFTPDLSASGVDTALIFQSWAYLGSSVPPGEA